MDVSDASDCVRTLRDHLNENISGVHSALAFRAHVSVLWSQLHLPELCPYLY